MGTARSAGGQAFATIYGITVATQNWTNGDYIEALFGIVAGAAYNQATFVDKIDDVVSLDTAMTSDARSAFATIYGITVATQNWTNGDYIEALFGIVAGTAYNQATFVDKIDDVVALDTAMTPAARNAFATIYGITVATQNWTNGDYIEALFGIVAGAAYNQATFVDKIDDVVSLDTAMTSGRRGLPSLRYTA